MEGLSGYEIERSTWHELTALGMERAAQVERAGDLTACAFGERVEGWRFLPYMLSKRYPWLIAPAPESLPTAQVIVYDPQNDCVVTVRHNHGNAQVLSRFSLEDLL
jgi:hypothetical protein